jgi:hypothetical protein
MCVKFNYRQIYLTVKSITFNRLLPYLLVESNDAAKAGKYCNHNIPLAEANGNETH